MSYEPKAGDEVYSADGALGVYVAPADGGGHIVQPMLQDGDGVTEPESYFADGVEIWRQVYREAPRPVLDEAIAAQQAKLSALKREVFEMEQLKRRAEMEQRDVRERLAQHEALQYLDQYLNAEITHYVSEVDGQIVVQDAKAFNVNRGFGYSERVLTLWAAVRDNAKALQWRIKVDNGYSGQRDIWAFPDADKARAKAVDLITAKMRSELATLKRGGTVYGIDAVLKNAGALGVEPLPELMEILRANELKAAQKAAADAQEAAAKAQQRLAALSVAA